MPIPFSSTTMKLVSTFQPAEGAGSLSKEIPTKARGTIADTATAKARTGKSLSSKLRWSRLLRNLRKNSNADAKKHQDDPFLVDPDATASLSMSLQSPSEGCFASVAFRSSSLFPPMSSVDEELDDVEESESSRPSLVTEPIAPEEEVLDYHITRNPLPELGYLSVKFQGSSLDQALALARQTQKPVLCLRIDDSGDGRIGAEVFSHPLIVEAAETLFVTVHRNTGGGDGGSSTRRREEEGRDARSHTSCPSSLDFLDDAGTQLLPSLQATAIHRESVVRAMIEALKLQQQTVPKYLQLLHEEESGRIEVAAFGVRYREHHSVFGMDDSANGEVEFAGLGGVLATKAGYIDRLRVVQVTYDSKVLSFSCLVRYALKRQVANIVYYQSNDERIAAQVEIERFHDTAQTKLFSGAVKPDFDQKPALRKTPLLFVPLTAYQSTRANRFVQLGRFDEAAHLLSPRQGLILMKTMHLSAQKALHNVVDVPLLPAWLSVCEEQHPNCFLETVNDRHEEDPCSDELSHDTTSSSSIYEYNSYSLSTACLPPGYPWHDF